MAEFLDVNMVIDVMEIGGVGFAFGVFFPFAAWLLGSLVDGIKVSIYGGR